MKHMQQSKDPAQKHYLIVGAGVSGLGAAKLLLKRGARVRVSEQKSLSEEQLQEFQQLGPDLEILHGGHKLDHLSGIDVVILSPGLPAKHLLVEEAKNRSLLLMSEIDLALNEYQGLVIGITGTNGKSTTCAMIYHMLEKLGCNASLGGNFGDPPSLLLAEDRAHDVMVLELSSYQLETSEKISPTAAVFTSFSNDHLARHGTIANYFSSKWRLFSENSAGLRSAIMPYWIKQEADKLGLKTPAKPFYIYRDPEQMREVNSDGAVIENQMITLPDGSTFNLFDIVTSPITRSLLQYEHNQVNLVFAAAVIRALPGYEKHTLPELLASINGFTGLRHRCELIGTMSGQPVYNDSKSTNVESTCVALKSQKKPVLLLMGGQGKGESYQPINECHTSIKEILCFGASGQKIADDLVGSFFPVKVFATLEEALAHVVKNFASHKAPVLFSPGCASFDEFRNYMHRGDYYCEYLRKYLDK